MPVPVKTPLRAAVEAEVVAALRNAPRALSLDELFTLVTVAEDKPTLSKILSHMKAAGTLVRDTDIKPGEPGGMGAKTKGARAVAAFRVPTEAEIAESSARPFSQTDASAEPDQARAPTFAPPPASVVASRSKLDTLESALKTPAPKTPEKPKAKPAPTPPAPDTDAPTASAPTLAAAIDAITAEAFAAIPDHALDDDGADQGDTEWGFDVLALREQTRDVALAIADQLIGNHPAYAAARQAARSAQKLADDYV